MRFILPIVMMASPAVAQEFVPREGDVVLDAAAMAADVVGARHEFYDGGVSFFSVSGTYTYTYADGGRAYGSYELRDGGAGGVVCTSFAQGFSRCDMYVRNADRLVLITQDGDRFPVRP